MVSFNGSILMVCPSLVFVCLCYCYNEAHQLVQFAALGNDITTWMQSIFTMKSPLKAVTAYLIKMLRSGVTGSCQEHEETVEKLLVSNYARLRLRVHLHQVAAKQLDGHASKTCARVSLQ